MRKDKEKQEREEAAEKFFSHNKRSLADIVPRRDTPDNAVDDENYTVNLPRDLPKPEEESKSVPFRIRKSHHKGLLPHKSLRLWIRAVVIFIVVAGALVYAVFILPRAEITIALEQDPWQFQGELLSSLTDKEFPLQIFSETKNVQLSFPASGKERVSRRARGIIKVCNALDSKPQALVATTRFLTPDGVIFRLDDAIDVPGATVSDGKIDPRCIEAKVTADKPGEAYNIEPVSKWTIPGFKGSPRYDGFYGVSEKPMVGGMVGEVKIPKEEDVGKAKEAARAKIREIIGTAFKVSAPEGIFILEDKEDAGFKIAKEVVIKETDSSGNFQYFIEARDERLAIRKEDALALIAKRAQAELGEEIELADYKLDVSLREKLYDSKKVLTGVRVAVDFNGGFVKPLTAADVKAQVTGKTETELSRLSLYGGRFKARITLWPFWVKRVPRDKDKITVHINIVPLPQTKLEETSVMEPKPL